jgi:ubiquinone/menaquinone biosynthesis C-methylase UbiE
MRSIVCDGETAATVEFFNQSAEEYYRRYGENSPAGYALRVRREKVLELFDQPGGKVLDVGCGPAVMTQAMLERGCSFWGADPSPRMIEISRKLFQENERVHFLSGDAMRMDFPDSQFDAVLCMGVIDAVHDRHQAVREMLRVLKPGGTLIMSFTNLSSPYSWWKLYVFYPVVSVWKRIRGTPALRPRRQGLWTHMKKRVLFTERAAYRLLTSEGAGIIESVGYYYNILLSPLDEIWPRGALWLTRRLEESRCRRLRWLAAGWIVKARKPLH